MKNGRSAVRRWLRIFAVAGVLGIIGVNVIAYRHAYAMLHFSPGGNKTGKAEQLSTTEKILVLVNGVNLPRPHTDVSPTVLGPSARAVTIPCSGGIKLGAWFCPSGASNPLVILFHGYGAEKSGMIREARAFLEMRHSVLLLDFRGSGESSESYTTAGFREADDVVAAIDYAREHLSPPKVILYGQSMGASAVLRSIHCCGVKPDAVIVEAVFDRMLNTTRHRFEAMKVPSFPCAELLLFWGGRQFQFDAFTHDPVQYAASVPCPVLFLHGSADPSARSEESRRVFDAVTASKFFREFPGSRHEPSIVRFPNDWKDAVGSFLTNTET
jgi:pimeloyl-ACP methyl ester carboxylesterase